MRVIPTFFSSLLLLLTAAATAVGLWAADAGRAPSSSGSGGGGPPDRVKIRAILVVASESDGPADPKLAPFSDHLRKNLPARLKRFQHAGEGSTQVSMPGGANLSLSRGQRLELEAAYQGVDQTWTRVRWQDGDREFMNTVVILRRGVPAVFGGLARPGGETLALIVIAE